jgi:DME family drug/metabolite transporter
VPPSRTLDGRLPSIGAVLAAAVLFGTTGTSQALGPPAATSLGIGAVRLVVGAIALAAIARLRRPGYERSWRRHAPTLLLGGVAVAVYQLGWFAGLRRTGVALGTVVGIGSGPVMAGLLHLARGRRGLSLAWVAGTAVTVLGAGLLAARGAGASSADPTGLALTLGAVLGYVLYVEAAQRAIRGGLDAEGTMAAMFGAGAVLLAPLLAIEPVAWLASPRGAAMALHLGVVTIGVAYTLYGWGLRRLAVPTVVTLTLAEPLTAAVLGTLVLGERLGPAGWLGATLVAAGLLVAARGEAAAGFRATGLRS